MTKPIQSMLKTCLSIVIATSAVGCNKEFNEYFRVQPKQPIIEAPNQAPIANAGPDRAILRTASASLAGSTSDDGKPKSPGVVSVSWTKVSGPGNVVASDAFKAATSATFSMAGTYVMRLTANDGELSSYDDVQIVVTEPNSAPQVNAGPDRAIQQPNSASLSGSASDDGQPSPPGALSLTWSKVSGPGSVTFASASQASTTATFSAVGTYVLRLTGYDGALSASDDMQVTVSVAPPPPNSAPQVSAGPDRAIYSGSSATLSGTITDDGNPNPPAATSATWSKVSGPGNVTFANSSAMSTTASFSALGTYVLRLTGNDGALSASDDMQVVVSAANTAPQVSAGPDRSIYLGANASLAGTIVDDGLPTPPGATTALWTKVSGPGTVTFASSTAVSTTASFSALGTYVLRLTGSDSVLTASDDVQVVVADPNQAPQVNAGADQSIYSGASASLSGSIVDDGLPTPPGATTASWTKVSGPGTVTFANSTSVSTTVTFSALGTYVLRLTGSDSVLTASDDVQVAVTTPPAPQTQEFTVGTTPTTAEIDILMLIDHSGSMAAKINEVKNKISAIANSDSLRSAKLRIAIEQFGEPSYAHTKGGSDNNLTLYPHLPAAQSNRKFNTLNGIWRSYAEIYPSASSGARRRLFDPTSDMASIQQAIAQIQLSTTAENENGMCNAALAYQSISTAGLETRIRANDAFRANAHSLVAIVVSDEEASTANSCAMTLAAPRSIAPYCYCYRNGVCQQTQTQTYNCPTDTNPNQTCTTTTCTSWNPTSDSYTTSCPATCNAGYQPQNVAGYSVFDGMDHANTVSHYVAAVQTFKQSYTPNRGFTLNFIGYTGDAGCTPPNSYQSVGHNYKAFAAATGGSSHCIDGDFTPAFQNIAQTISETNLVYDITSPTQVTSVTRTRAGVVTTLIRDSEYWIENNTIRLSTLAARVGDLIKVYY